MYEMIMYRCMACVGMEAWFLGEWYGAGVVNIVCGRWWWCSGNIWMDGKLMQPHGLLCTMWYSNVCTWLLLMKLQPWPAFCCSMRWWCLQVWIYSQRLSSSYRCCMPNLCQCSQLGCQGWHHWHIQAWAWVHACPIDIIEHGTRSSSGIFQDWCCIAQGNWWQIQGWDEI